MGETKNSVNTPAKEILLLKKRLDRARAALLKSRDGQGEAKLRKEMNDIADRLGWLLADEERYDEALAMYDTVDPKDTIAHFYFGIDYEIVWQVATEKLPAIRPAIEKMFKALKTKARAADKD